MIMGTRKRKKLWMHVVMTLWMIVIIILVFMNVVKTSATKLMNDHTHHQILPEKYPYNKKISQKFPKSYTVYTGYLVI